MSTFRAGSEHITLPHRATSAFPARVKATGQFELGFGTITEFVYLFEGCYEENAAQHLDGAH